MKPPKLASRKKIEIISIEALLASRGMIFQLVNQVLNDPKNEGIIIANEEEDPIAIMRKVSTAENETLSKLMKRKIDNFSGSVFRLLSKWHILLVGDKQNVVIESLIIEANAVVDQGRKQIEAALIPTSIHDKEISEAAPIKPSEKAKTRPSKGIRNELIDSSDYEIVFLLDSIDKEKLMSDAAKGKKILLMKGGKLHAILRPSNKAEDGKPGESTEHYFASNADWDQIKQGGSKLTVNGVTIEFFGESEMIQKQKRKKREKGGKRNSHSSSHQGMNIQPYEQATF